MLPLGRLIAMVAVMLAAAMTAGLTTGMAAEKGDAKSGKAPYQQFCAVCHGKTGLGDGPMAKSTTPPAPRLTVRDVRDMSDERLLDAIANGVGAAMPAWRGLLNDQQLLDVTAYVRSLAGS